MKKFVIKLFWLARLVDKIGILAFFRYCFSLNGTQVQLVISGHEICVRKGSRDLGVAVSCFFGEFEAVRYLFPEDYDGVIVDGGGYIGTSALALRDIFPAAKIVVIEASRDNFAVLEKNLSTLKNVELVYGALVGTASESIELRNRGTGEWGYTVVKTPVDKPNAEILHSTPGFRLSDLVKKDEKIGLLKLDIEGGELDLLENDVSSMTNVDVVFAELHDRIIPGCRDMFLQFSEDRVLVKGQGEKYLSVKR